MPGGFPYKAQIQQEGSQFSGKAAEAEARDAEQLAEQELENQREQERFGKEKQMRLPIFASFACIIPASMHIVLISIST